MFRTKLSSYAALIALVCLFFIQSFHYAIAAPVTHNISNQSELNNLLSGSDLNSGDNINFTGSGPFSMSSSQAATFFSNVVQVNSSTSCSVSISASSTDFMTLSGFYVGNGVTLNFTGNGSFTNSTTSSIYLQNGSEFSFTNNWNFVNTNLHLSGNAQCNFNQDVDFQGSAIVTQNTSSVTAIANITFFGSNSGANLQNNSTVNLNGNANVVFSSYSTFQSSGNGGFSGLNANSDDGLNKYGYVVFANGVPSGHTVNFPWKTPCGTAFPFKYKNNSSGSLYSVASRLYPYSGTMAHSVPVYVCITYPTSGNNAYLQFGPYGIAPNGPLTSNFNDPNHCANHGITAKTESETNKLNTFYSKRPDGSVLYAVPNYTGSTTFYLDDGESQPLEEIPILPPWMLFAFIGITVIVVSIIIIRRNIAS